MNRTLIEFAMIAVPLGVASFATGEVNADVRPNILWITIEDWSPDLSCYGTKGLQTPHVDKLVPQAIRYERAFTTSPVCSTSRSAMMTGFHQNYIGANQHREYDKQPLPHDIQPIQRSLLAVLALATVLSHNGTMASAQTTNLNMKSKREKP